MHVKKRAEKGTGAGWLVCCQLEIWLLMLQLQGHDSSSEGDAVFMLGSPSKHLLAT